MTARISLILSFALIAAALIAGLVLYNRLPDPMPSHWNTAGQVDDTMPRAWGVFLIPLITAGIALLFQLIPRIDPYRANIAQFRGLFNTFIVAFTAYMLYVYALTLAAALGLQFNMSMALLPAVGLLFVGVGYLMQNARRNFFIGIRTPWTLSSDKVWDETHRLGARLFMLAGAVTVVSAFLGEAGFWLLMAAVLLAAFIPIIYSYILWKRDNP